MVVATMLFKNHWKMKTLLTLVLFIALVPTLSAQSQSTLDKAAENKRSCMLMSDSVRTALGLTPEQAELVRKSDERCLKACEKAGFRTTGGMDKEAMIEHAFEMREILNEEQFEQWSSMCGTYGAPPPASVTDTTRPAPSIGAPTVP